MFENLTNRLSGVMKTLRGQARRGSDFFCQHKVISLFFINKGLGLGRGLV